MPYRRIPRRLVNALALLPPGRPPGTVAPARVTSLGQNNVTIETRVDGTLPGQLATTEVLAPGQRVWTVKMDDGSYLILGSVAEPGSGSHDEHPPDVDLTA